MSSPEFQAELMQVARKVRNKLNYGGRPSMESVNITSLERKSNTDRCVKLEETKRPEKRSARNEESTLEECRIEDRVVSHEERRLVERCNRSENKRNVYDEHKKNAHNLGRTKDYLEERQAEAGSGGKRRLVEKQTTLDDSSAVHSRDPSRRNLKDRVDVQRHSSGERFRLTEKQRRELIDDYQRAKSVPKNRKYDNTTDQGRTRSESPLRSGGKDRTSDLREQDSGRLGIPERMEAKEREKENSDCRRRKSDVRNTDGADEKRWSEPVPVTEKKDAKSKEKLTKKPEVKEACEKNWHV